MLQGDELKLHQVKESDIHEVTVGSGTSFLLRLLQLLKPTRLCVCGTAGLKTKLCPIGLWLRVQPGDLSQTLEQVPKGFIRVMDEEN